MAIRPSGVSSAAGSAPVFERKLDSAVGSLTIRRFARDADPAVFRDLAPIAALWQRKCRGDRLPRWRDFSFEDFVGWHRYVALSDIAVGKADPKFRICGSGLAEMVGFDVTGKKMSEAFPIVEDDGIYEHFAAIRDQSLIGFLEGNLGRLGYEHRNFQAIELPLVKDGDTVVQLLHAMLPPGHWR